jgi:hypothetical protein
MMTTLGHMTKSSEEFRAFDEVLKGKREKLTTLSMKLWMVGFSFGLTTYFLNLSNLASALTSSCVSSILLENRLSAFRFTHSSFCSLNIATPSSKDYAKSNLFQDEQSASSKLSKHF